MTDEWWAHPRYIDWVQCMLRSFRRWTGRELIERAGTLSQQAKRVYTAPFVLVSHDHREDPILNYGNRAALELWGLPWEDFSRTPSRLTAEKVERPERARMLAEAAQRGYILDYQGVRVAHSGRRFFVEHAVVWNVLDVDEKRLGQAASFSTWRWLD